MGKYHIRWIWYVYEYEVGAVGWEIMGAVNGCHCTLVRTIGSQIRGIRISVYGMKGSMDETNMGNIM